jgi:hypothetical protein
MNCSGGGYKSIGNGLIAVLLARVRKTDCLECLTRFKEDFLLVKNYILIKEIGKVDNTI